MSRLLVVGLDCATPQFLFGDWLEQLPHFKSLVERGIHGPLRSIIPPITVPAWACMMASQDPGQLGIYGFRNRRSHDYEDLYVVNAKNIKAQRVWNHLSRNRLSSLLFGVPQTYPPAPLRGMMVTSFLAPGKDVTFTYPADIAAELDRAADGDYIIDVKDFRTDDKETLKKQIWTMTQRRFKAFRHFYRKEDFDFAMVVEMGPDRIHHGFWRYADPQHRLYEPGNRYERVIFDYYRLLDEELGMTLEAVGPDTSVLVVSDHGADTMIGAVCINEWLMREGYLKLKEQPRERMRLRPNMVDWEHTSAWGEGGYYARVFLNVAGREPQGTIPAADYDATCNELRERLEAMTDEEGKPLGTRVFRPREIYREIKAIPPDLVVYLGNLKWRSAGTVGNDAIYLYENDTGPDDANHAEDGILIWALPEGKKARREDLYSIYDIAPSILRFFDLEIPEEMIGKSIIE